MNYHIVEYHNYCNKCKYKNLPGHEEPCNECLLDAIREDSRIPINYEEDTSQKNNAT